MQKHIALVASSGLICAHAPPLAAQSINPALDRQKSESRISAAVTVPLGASRDSRQTAPRVEIIARSRAPEAAFAMIARDNDRDWQERRVGFTLQSRPSVMINGRSLSSAEQADGITTGGAIAIGLGALLALSTATLIDGVDAIEDLTDED